MVSGLKFPLARLKHHLDREDMHSLSLRFIACSELCVLFIAVIVKQFFKKNQVDILFSADNLNSS